MTRGYGVDAAIKRVPQKLKNDPDNDALKILPSKFWMKSLGGPVGNEKTLVYWTDNRWAPYLQDVTYGMVIDQNYDDPSNWTNGTVLSMNPSQANPQIAYNDGNYLRLALSNDQEFIIDFLSECTSDQCNTNF